MTGRPPYSLPATAFTRGVYTSATWRRSKKAISECCASPKASRSRTCWATTSKSNARPIPTIRSKPNISPMSTNGRCPAARYPRYKRGWRPCTASRNASRSGISPCGLQDHKKAVERDLRLQQRGCYRGHRNHARAQSRFRLWLEAARMRARQSFPLRPCACELDGVHRAQPEHDCRDVVLLEPEGVEVL